MPEYHVGIVGESYRQNAIRRCGPGDPVVLIHEPRNPHDGRAISVKARGQQIGFLPRGGWLTSAILDEGKRVIASIASIAPGGGDHLAVVLLVKWTES